MPLLRTENRGNRVPAPSISPNCLQVCEAGLRLPNGRRGGRPLGDRAEDSRKVAAHPRSTDAHLSKALRAIDGSLTELSRCRPEGRHQEARDLMSLLSFFSSFFSVSLCLCGSFFFAAVPNHA